MEPTQPESPKLVRDLMTVGVATCTPDTPVIDIARLILDKGLEAIVVLDERHAIGVVGQEELIRAYTRPEARNLTAEEIMRDELPQVLADIPLTTAVQLMLDQGVRILFVTHHAGGVRYPAAMISYKHILRHLASQNEEALNDLGIRAERQSPLESFIQRRDAAKQKRLSQTRKT